MCRFAAYLGPVLRIEGLTTLPSHSIIKQSYRAQERIEPLNGDGFGVAWFNSQLSDRPAAYRAIAPAWNDENLIHLARLTESHCILAHVRAASPGLGVSRFKCHPFLGDRFAFMHNGSVAGFSKIKRQLLAELPDELWSDVRGTTDSEVIFAIFRHVLPQRTEPTATERMRGAIEATIAHINRTSEAHGVTEPHQLNLCVTDGESMVATRYCTLADQANSLYINEGNRYICIGDLCKMIEPDEHGGAVLIASEALSEDDGWEKIQGNISITVASDRSVTRRAIPD